MCNSCNSYQGNHRETSDQHEIISLTWADKIPSRNKETWCFTLLILPGYRQANQQYLLDFLERWKHITVSLRVQGREKKFAMLGERWGKKRLILWYFNMCYQILALLPTSFELNTEDTKMNKTVSQRLLTRIVNCATVINGIMEKKAQEVLEDAEEAHSPLNRIRGSFLE